MENGFILLLEKEIFIDQLKDIVDKAEDMLHEDMGDEKDTTLSCSPLQGQMSEAGEVRAGSTQIHGACQNVNLSGKTHVCKSFCRVSSQGHRSLYISRMVTPHVLKIQIQILIVSPLFSLRRM